MQACSSPPPPPPPADECRDEAFVLPPDVLRELQKEAALLLKLRHQNIVSFMARRGGRGWGAGWRWGASRVQAHLQN